MVHGFSVGVAGINVLSRHAGIAVKVVDMGCKADLSALVASGAVIDAKVGPGTANMRQGTAMSRDQALLCIERGASIARNLASEGARMIGTGDMGIGNTTASSAIFAALSGKSVAEVTGRGTGATDEQLQHKIDVIRRAMDVNRPNPDKPLEVLAKVGGFEIGGLAGVMLGAAANHIPVVIDGFISGAAALVATALEPRVKDYLIAAHCSAEAGHVVLLNYLGLKPLLNLEMRLGEGTGAALGLYIAEAGVRTLNEMATFAEAAVDEGGNTK
jgi:nicotinate-nucleotide--dimethylbenzimidazole phosphoribosyltransferase